MTNYFGEEVDPADHQIHFEWFGATLNILRGKEFTNARGVKGCRKYVGTVTPNGWNGNSMNVWYPLGMPLLSNINDVISFAEFEAIMAEYNLHMPPKVVLQNVIARLAEEKHISVDAAIEYVAQNKIPTIKV